MLSPNAEEVLKVTAFDPLTRYCTGTGTLYQQLLSKDPHALDDGFWGRPTDIKLREKKEDTKTSIHSWYHRASPIVVYCRWCQEHLHIDCTPVDVTSIVAKGESALGNDLPRELFNEDFTALGSGIICSSAQTHKALTSFTKGDFVVRIVRSPVVAGITALPVSSLFRRPELSSSSSEAEATASTSSTADARFLVPTLTEFAIEITHIPTRESVQASNKRLKGADANAAVVQVQTEAQVPRPCFVIDSLIVDGRQVKTTWKGETLFCTTGVATFTGYDWEATNAGSFLYKATPDALHLALDIQLVTRTGTWLPPIKSALPHMSAHAALEYAQQQQQQQQSAMSCQSSFGGPAVSGGRGGFGGGYSDSGLAARLNQHRMGKQVGLVADKDAGAGHRIVSCTGLLSSLGKQFTLNAADDAAATSTTKQTIVLGLVCSQTAASVQKDHARMTLHDYGLDYWTRQQKQSRKRIREAEKQLEELRKDLDDLNSEVTGVVHQHANLVRLFTPQQLEDDAAQMATGETPEITARLAQLEQQRFAATNMHFEV